MAISDIVISPATIYYAPVGEALPSADTVAYGGTWPGNWRSMGTTLTSVKMKYEQELFKLMVDQLSSPVKRFRDSEEAAIETTLAEFVGAYLNLALDGTVSTTVAAASVRGKEVVEVGGSPFVSEYAIGIEGFNKKDGSILLPVRVFFYKANIILNGELEFSRKAAVGTPLRIEASADPSKVAGKNLMVIHRVIAKATNET